MRNPTVTDGGDVSGDLWWGLRHTSQLVLGVDGWGPGPVSRSLGVGEGLGTVDVGARNTRNRGDGSVTDHGGLQRKETDQTRPGSPPSGSTRVHSRTTPLSIPSVSRPLLPRPYHVPSFPRPLPALLPTPTGTHLRTSLGRRSSLRRPTLPSSLPAHIHPTGWCPTKDSDRTGRNHRDRGVRGSRLRSYLCWVHSSVVNTPSVPAPFLTTVTRLVDVSSSGMSVGRPTSRFPDLLRPPILRQEP